MPTAVSRSSFRGLVRAARPKSPLLLHHISSHPFSPSLIAQHATSAVRSSAGPEAAAPQHEAGAFKLEREINPFEVSFAPGRPKPDESTPGNGVGARGTDSARPDEGEEQQPRGGDFRGFLSPALAILSDSSGNAERSRLAGSKEQRTSEWISTASRISQLSPSGPIEHARSIGSNSTGSAASAESVLLATSARSRRPSCSTTIGSKPSLSPSSFRVPSISIAPSAGSSALFDLVRDQLAEEGSVAQLRHVQRAPLPLAPLPPATSPPPTNLFLFAAPISPPQPVPESAPIASTSRMSPRSLRPNPSFTLTSTTSPTVPPRRQAIFLPPLDQTPTLTPSTTALEIARSPPAPPSASPAEVGPIAPLASLPSASSTPRRRNGKGKLPAAALEDEVDELEEDAIVGEPSSKRLRGVAVAAGAGQESATDALERNRQAAKKSRGKKKEYIEGLAATEQALSRDNERLEAEIARLQAESLALRQQLSSHQHQAGCGLHPTIGHDSTSS